MEGQMKKVITYGTYDLFHEGHYKLLQRAKALGDYLIVGVTTEHFDEARGKVNVVDSIMDRIENVRKTGFADEIIVEDHDGQKIEDIQRYGVDIFTVGSDWIGTFDYLKQFCEVVYLERTPDISSTLERKNKFKIVNVGIVGTGRIAPRFISEAKYVSGINIACTYNPQNQSAQAFSNRHDIPNYSGEYEEFLEQVDAVYIASPNETHYDYARKALANGKHVLCEKPAAFTKREAQGLYQYAMDNGLVLMEAVKTAYCPGFSQLVNMVQSGKIGKVCDVEACFTRLANDNSRERTDAAYGGAFLEFGSYTLLPVIKLLGTDYKDIHFDTIYDENGVDLYTKVYLSYDNAMALSKNGVAVKSEGQLVVAGTKGYVLAPSPWWLTRRFEVHFEDSSKVEVYEPVFQGDGFRYEISDFVSKINGIDKNGYKLTAEEAIAMAEVTEAYMKQKKR
jgi:glycerol-3-phosphate cytidylyltransferase